MISCFLTQAFARRPDDVIGSFLLRLARGLHDHGVDVAVVAPHAAGLALHETLDGIRVTRFRYAPDRLERLAYRGRMHELVKENVLNGLLFSTFLTSFVVESVCAVRRQRADIIHAHWWFPSGLVGGVVSALTGVPLVVTCHGTDVALLDTNPMVLPVARWVFRRASAVTVVSDYLRQQLLSHLPELACPVSVIAMPVERVFTEVNDTRQPDPGERRMILSVGRLTLQKGLDHLLQACRMLVERGLDVGITFVGEGEAEQALRTLVHDLGLQDRVVFAGSRPPKDLVHYYRACDVAVLPSLDEGLGLTLVEAMFCGVPVVGSDTGGIASLIVDGETGLLVPPADTSALAQALGRVLTDPTYARRLAVAGQAYARQHYDPDVLIRRTLDVYQSVKEAHA